MSEDNKYAARFLCALDATMVKPISDLRLLISDLRLLISGLRALLCALSLLCSLLLALCSEVEAQQTAKIPRIGVLISTPPSIAAPRIQALQQGLHGLGYIEGRNISIEYRYAEGKLEPLAQLADELVRLKLDLIVTDTSRATQAAKDATKTIPVVFTSANDPLGDGQVASLARPGGNLTGFSLLAPDLNAKRLEILKETVPTATQIGFLTRAGAGMADQRFKEAEADAQRLGLRLHRLGAKGPDDLEGAFEAAKRAGVQAILAHPSTFVVTNRARIIELATKHRLPVIYSGWESAAVGGLMSYGLDIVDNYRRAAGYVDKILKGAKPADLPVQQPMKFEFV
ncbi:MAG TPA: ABC transporter substrate-binding protein, partial [Candidatus Binatia bacterium]|nr:ABC transporter substrate-binding protein [Candidatus Binatia bacterium]